MALPGHESSSHARHDDTAAPGRVLSHAPPQSGSPTCLLVSAKELKLLLGPVLSDPLTF
jgi:hypothetical protein